MRNKLQVEFLSTWNKKCGIAEYTRYLMDQLQKFPVQPFCSGLEEKVQSHITHLQWTAGFFRNRKINFTGKQVTTIHTFSYPTYFKRILEIANKSDAVVAHHRDSMKLLSKNTDIPVYHIPHGSNIFNPLEKKIARNKVGWSGKDKYGFIFGFGGPRKALERGIKAQPFLNSNFKLIFSFSPHMSGHRTSYLKKLKELAKKLHVQKRIHFMERFLSDKEINEYCSASDVLILTDRISDDNLSASGALHRILSANRPIITSHANCFREAKHGIHCLKFETPKELAEAIEKVLTDKHLRRNISKNAVSLAKETGWEKVAERHYHMYGDLIGG